MSEHNFVVGDIVKAKRDGCGYKKGDVVEVRSYDYSPEYINIFNKNRSRMILGCIVRNFELVESVHTGKILIMVDEKDPDKIIARDLITNKTAEAKRNPKDEWDFNKGAKLALERLMEPEKPKGWTGKVVCIQAFQGHDRLLGKFVNGRVYRVENGQIFCEDGLPWIRLPGDLFMNSDEVDHHFNRLSGGTTRFIEYKGGAEE